MINNILIYFLIYMTDFITKEGLKELDNYKYVGGKYTYIDNILNPFWLKVSECLPMWMAPNLVTFIGFITLLMTYGFMIMYDSSLQKDIPSWTFYYAAIATFIY